MRRTLILLIACSAIAALIAPAGAAEMTTARSVAILDFENANKTSHEDDWLCAGMAETLITKLRQVKDLRLVERKQIIKAMEELNFSATDFFDSDKSAQLAKFLKVDALLVGGFQRYGDTIRLTARFVDVGTGEVLDAVDIKGEMNDIFDLQDQLALELIESMGIAATSKERKAVATKSTTSLSALELYSKAINAGDEDESITLFEQAIEADPQYKEAYNDLAVVYMGRGDYAKAVELLNKALAIDANYFLADYNLGVCYNQLGQPDESAKAYKRAIEHNANYLSSYHALADLYIRIGDFRHAIDVARQATEIEPSDPNGYNLWGNALYGQDRYADAIDKYQQVVELDPESAYVYYNIANCYVGLKDTDQALAYYARALEVDAQYALAYYRRAELYLSVLEEPAKAAVDFADYLKLAENDPDGYLGLARASVRLGRIDDAKQAYENVVKLVPNPDALNELANILFDEGDYDGAEALYLRALEADPDYLFGYHNLGRLYAYVRNDQDAAATYFEKALGVNREYAPALYELSLVELRRSQWDDMITYLMRGRRLDPDNSFWPYYLGYAYDEKAQQKRREGKTRVAERYSDTAQKHLLEAAQLDPDDPDVYNLLGNLQLNAGKPADAVPYYQQALKANADHLFANVNLGTAMRQLSRYDEAKGYFEHAIKIDPKYAFSYWQLGQILDQDLHRPNDALSYYRHYLELAGTDEDVEQRVEEIEKGTVGDGATDVGGDDDADVGEM
jgi:tetratricopeptide (TPR) repeat protein